MAVAAQPASVNAWTRLPDLRIRTQLAQLANRPNHDPLSVASTDPLDAHQDALTVPLYVHYDPFDNLANDLFALRIAGGWSSPKRGNIRRQAANRLPFGFRKEAWLVLNKPMILLLKLLLSRQFLFPGVFYTIKGQELRIGRSEIPASANC
jgi:hypothetical protein